MYNFSIIKHSRRSTIDYLFIHILILKKIISILDGSSCDTTEFDL